MSKQEKLFATRNLPTKKKPSLDEQLAEAGLPEPADEYMFAAQMGRRWRFDRAFLDYRVAVEIEGGVFGRVILGADGKRYRLGGRHNSGADLAKDAEKYNEAQIQGWMVIRVTTTQIRDKEAIEPIRRALIARGWRGHAVMEARSETA